jgi:hypothetical protein
MSQKHTVLPLAIQNKARQYFHQFAHQFLTAEK